ncbi:hypothetical protein BDQ17DRAFT_1424815 [Cyathus striatus]|nr:hypothetical protein BDQ17DRAFT_1424815 [Cyathus striatus]
MLIEVDKGGLQIADEVPASGALDEDNLIMGVLEPVEEACEVNRPQLPDIYIKMIPHPHSKDSITTIIPLMATSEGSCSAYLADAKVFAPPGEDRPWAPFQTHADFEYTEMAVKGLLSEKLVNVQLTGIHNGWSVGGSELMIHNYKEMSDSLVKTREYGIQFKHEIILAVYHGQKEDFEFYYHDPWEYILNLIHDKSLALISCWNSVHKFYCS